MGCDTLKEITIVIADGEKVTVKDCGNGDPKKDMLFWALCGAGGGNFGVVVKMKLQFKSSNATKLWLKDILGGHMKIRKRWKTLWRRCKEMQRFYTTAWPNHRTIDSSWLCDLSQINIGLRFLVCHDGHKAEFKKTHQRKYHRRRFIEVTYKMILGRAVFSISS
ncbi:uncharacterized protein TrAFT101_011830 [Trichoderma asperellum]|uniref:uncharacterized protein n=1 Tax=Trichoderma asperellum TaxID=101201 RepID=UPI003316896A|nr:hypothetical protein TrAFT101_011830 [Trichoderma asperellum]